MRNEGESSTPNFVAFTNAQWLLKLDNTGSGDRPD